jgi:hypothetical protein
MENFIIRNYGVVFKYYKEEEFTQLHFTMEVSYKGELRDGSHYFIINRKKIFINETAPDLVIEKLAESAGSCLYPMEIITNQEGPFQEIKNYEAIKKRWNEKKIAIQDYYKGEIAEKIIANLDAVYSSKQKMEIAMNDDLFITLFFMPIYRKHINRIADYKKEIAFIPFNQPISYEIIQEVDKFLTESKKQMITIKGHSDKSLRGEPELQLDYKINNETKSLFSIVGSVNLEKEKGNTQKIEIEMYQLDENY